MKVGCNFTLTVRGIERLLVLGGFFMTMGFVVASCGSGSESNTSSIVPPANVSNQNVEQTLKFDSRVQDFDTDGDTLTISVNDLWMKSPQGLQERAVDGWLAGWKAERAADGGSVPKGLTVLVRYDGNDVAKATQDRGIEMLGKPAAKSDE